MSGTKSRTDCDLTFKEEAGSDARYLSDLIKRKTGRATYLDSNELVDLRTLFNEGELTTLHTYLSQQAQRARTQHAYAEAAESFIFSSSCVRQVFTSRTLLSSSPRRAS